MNLESNMPIQPKKHRAACFFALWAMASLLIVLIFIASWAPDSRMAAQPWVPGWLAKWADRSPNIRTAVPFIPLAFLLTWGFKWRGIKYPALGSLLMCGACLGLAELGQLFLPARTADVADLWWGAAGIAAGLGCAWVLRWWLLRKSEAL